MGAGRKKQTPAKNMTINFQGVDTSLNQLSKVKLDVIGWQAAKPVKLGVLLDDGQQIRKLEIDGQKVDQFIVPRNAPSGHPHEDQDPIFGDLADFRAEPAGKLWNAFRIGRNFLPADPRQWFNTKFKVRRHNPGQMITWAVVFDDPSITFKNDAIYGERVLGWIGRRESAGKRTSVRRAVRKSSTKRPVRSSSTRATKRRKP